MDLINVRKFCNSLPEDKQYNENVLCLICRIERVNTIFLPCNHIKICSVCFINRQTKFCITCRKKYDLVFCFNIKVVSDLKLVYYYSNNKNANTNKFEVSEV